MLLYDLSHTSHSRARTGVQRVALELRRALKDLPHEVQEVTYDPHGQSWRFLRQWEQAALDRPVVAAKRRGAYWPWSAQLRGRIDRLGRRARPTVQLPPDGSGFFTPEIFTQRTGTMLPALFEHLSGPKVALFHDAISMRMPDLAPLSTVGRFPAYLAELHDFDGVMAVSEDSRQSLIGYWDWAGWENHPPVIAASLGLDHLVPRGTPDLPPVIAPTDKTIPTVLCVGSLEGRKNHLTLLDASERLWSQGEQFQLRLIGTLQRETGLRAMNRLTELQGRGRPIQYDGWLSDDDLRTAFAQAAFTVYPSLREGFGLPVWESIIQARACICSGEGATGETAAGGGCLTVDTRSAAELGEAIRRLLHDGDLRQRLNTEAAGRTPPRWADTARRLVDWMGQLPASNSN